MTTVEERTTADRVGTPKPTAPLTGAWAGLAARPATRTRLACAGRS
ncbi:hypothetical protein BKA00_007199 [Actinomadura coerulea]|uniref:Uncharacterized protein n=1 Tax=Actinomadura coerulea TaxID=46159 RepID=A0A7X0G846_9ACTN|nr:hypothetical protein [Actinomadura coerulea]MBB6400285.1 hypothetical protein [Actinomadura coerulea]